jgi:hypothetical protein
MPTCIRCPEQISIKFPVSACSRYVYDVISYVYDVISYVYDVISYVYDVITYVLFSSHLETVFVQVKDSLRVEECEVRTAMEMTE